MMKRNPHPEVANILRSIDEAYDHAAWHGPNLRGSLRGLTAAHDLPPENWTSRNESSPGI